MNILTQSGHPKGILMLNIGEHPESARALRAGELVALAAFAQVGFRVDPQDARDAEKGT